MRRELGTFETAATLTNERHAFVVVVVVRLAAAKSPERLRYALDALQRRHPPLAVRIVEHGGCFRYEPEGTPRIPLRVVERAGEEHWREVTERELDARIDAVRGPLARCTFLAPPEPLGDTPAEILLSFHHAIVDAASGTALVGELLRLCGPADGPVEPAVDEAPSLPPVEDLFPPAYRGIRGALRSVGFLARQMADEAVYRLRTRRARPAPAAAPAGCRILPVRLPREETSALVRATRRRRVTLNAALGAAFLLAVHRHLPEAAADREHSRPMRYMTFADLRPYLKPPVGNDALGGYLAMMRYTTRVEGKSGESGRDSAEPFWGLARRITDQVAAGSRRGDKLWSVLFSEKVMRMMLGQRAERMAHTAVSYSGVTRLDAEGVRELHAFVSNIPVGPEYTALARMFGGELLLDVLYLDTDMDPARARTVADGILAALRGAGTE